MRSFYLIGSLSLIACTPRFEQGVFATDAGAGGEGSNGSEMVGVSGRTLGRGPSMPLPSNGGSRNEPSDGGEGSQPVNASGGLSGSSSTVSDGGEGSTAGEAGANSLAGAGGDSGMGAAGELNHPLSCVDTGVTIHLTSGGLSIASLCTCDSDLKELRSAANCGNVPDTDEQNSVFSGCLSTKPPPSGTRICFDAELTAGGYACEHVGQEYCGNLAQYTVTVAGDPVELFSANYPADCAAIATCDQAVCFIVP